MIVILVIALAVWLFGKFVATKGVTNPIQLWAWVYIPMIVVVISLGFIVYSFFKRKK
jgi:Ni,Fe-hydrogenase I cytochrome b subunit